MFIQYLYSSLAILPDLNQLFMRVNVNLSRSKEHLVFTENVFDEDGLLLTTKRAAQPISPDFDPEDVLAIARTKEWEIVGEPNEDGFSTVRRVRATADVVQPQ